MRVVGLIVALVALASAAEAQTLDVNGLIHQGVELRRERRDREALEVFQQAWEVSHAPRVMAQIGFAELALGRWVDAEAHLIEAHSAATDPWIAEHRGLLEEAMRDVGQHVGSLDVRGNVAGAEVRVEGRRVGALPFARPVRVAAGTTTLEVGAPGYLPVRRSIVVAPASLTREAVSLLGLDVPFGTPPPPALDDVRPPPATPHDVGATMRTLGWTAAGGALVGVGIGVAALVVRNDAVGRWNDNACLANGRTRLENCGDEQDTAVTMGAVSVAGWVTGAALAVTSAVLFVTAPSSAGRARRELRMRDRSWRRGRDVRGDAVRAGRVVVMAAGMAALGVGCPGLLPPSDRAFDGAVTIDAPVITLDRGMAVDAPVMVVDRPAPVDVPVVVEVDRPAPMDVPVAAVDRPAPTDVVTVVGDSGPPPDTGAVTTGANTPGCGRNNMPCCQGGACEGGRACLVPAAGGAARCVDCGGNHQPCCAYGGCDRDKLCVVGAAGATCEDCGGGGQTCCAFGACDGERQCVATPGRAPTCR